MAEGIVRQKAIERGIELTVDSCGTSGYHDGEPSDPRSISTMHKHQIDITDLRSRKFRLSDFDEFDELFVMDKSNQENILKLARSTEDKNKIKLFLNEAYPGEDKEVPDPYYGGDSGFDNVYDMLCKAANNFLDRI